MRLVYLVTIILIFIGCSARQVSKTTKVEDLGGDGILLLSTDIEGKNFNESITLTVEKYNPETNDLEKFSTISISGLTVNFDFDEYVAVHTYRFPPGDYMISGFVVNGGNNKQTNASAVSIYFGVAEDKVNYIGEIKLIKELNWLEGGSFKFKVSDKMKRDYTVFKGKYNKLESMDVSKSIARSI